MTQRGPVERMTVLLNPYRSLRVYHQSEISVSPAGRVYPGKFIRPTLEELWACIQVSWKNHYE